MFESSSSIHRLARRGFIVGSIGFIVIGALHTVTHFAELADGDLEERFGAVGVIDVSQQLVSAWDLFQGTSLLMGLFSMAIGFGSLGGLRASGHPPLGTAVTNATVLAGVSVIGVAHLGPLQLWGGLFGIAMFAPTMLLAMSGRRASHDKLMR